MSDVERLAELKKKQADREAKRREKSEALEVQLYELLDKYETELGARGSAFDILDLRSIGEGFIAVRLPDGLYHKRFTVALDRAITRKTIVDPADAEAYVGPHILHPTLDEYHAIVTRRGEVAMNVAKLCMRMHRGTEEEEAGK